MPRRRAIPPRPDVRQAWQIEQGKRCGCRGSDDLCACQNAEEPWKYGLGGQPPPTREQQLEAQVRRLEGTIHSLELQLQTDRETIRSLTASPDRILALVEENERKTAALIAIAGRDNECGDQQWDPLEQRWRPIRDIARSALGGEQQ